MKQSFRFTATGAQFRAALKRDNDDRAALMFFLLGAEKEGQMQQGRSGADAVQAAARLLNISDEALEILRSELA